MVGIDSTKINQNHPLQAREPEDPYIYTDFLDHQTANADFDVRWCDRQLSQIDDIVTAYFCTVTQIHIFKK